MYSFRAITKCRKTQRRVLHAASTMLGSPACPLPGPHANSGRSESEIGLMARAATAIGYAWASGPG